MKEKQFLPGSYVIMACSVKAGYLEVLLYQLGN